MGVLKVVRKGARVGSLLRVGVILLFLLVAGAVLTLGSGTAACWVRPGTVISCLNNTYWALVGSEISFVNNSYDLRVGPLFVDASGGVVDVTGQLSVNGSPVLTALLYNNTDTHVAGSPPYLYNDTTTMYFNESKLNQTISVRVNNTVVAQNSCVGSGFVGVGYSGCSMMGIR